MHIVSSKSLIVDVLTRIRKFYASANAIFCSSKYVSELTRLCLCESFVLPVLTYGCEGADLSTDNINRLNICWLMYIGKFLNFVVGNRLNLSSYIVSG